MGRHAKWHHGVFPIALTQLTPNHLLKRRTKTRKSSHDKRENSNT
jgi:hypothetical protein